MPGDEHTDYIATELLRELKEGNVRKDAQIAQMAKNQIRTFYGFMIVILLIVSGFLLYLNQYDFTSTTTTTTTNTAEGVYAIIDSEGNVIASDLTSEEIERIMSTYGTDDQENYGNDN